MISFKFCTKIIFINFPNQLFESFRPNSLRRVKKKSDDDRKHQFLEKKTNSLKFYLREIDIEKHEKSGSSGTGDTRKDEPGSSHSISEDKNSNTELAKSEFSASFLAQTNWSFVEKLLKV